MQKPSWRAPNPSRQELIRHGHLRTADGPDLGCGAGQRRPSDAGVRVTMKIRVTVRYSVSAEPGLSALEGGDGSDRGGIPVLSSCARQAFGMPCVDCILDGSIKGTIGSIGVASLDYCIAKIAQAAAHHGGDWGTHACSAVRLHSRQFSPDAVGYEYAPDCIRSRVALTRSRPPLGWRSISAGANPP